MPPTRIAVLATHPIQYQAPLFRRLAQEPDIALKVFFCSDFSTRAFFDTEFATTVEWDVPLLEGYDSEVLPAWRPWPHPQTFWRPFNRGLSRRLKQGGFDWLLILNYHRFISYQAAVAARALGVRVAVRDEPTATSAARGPLKQALKRAFFAAYAPLVDRFLAIGTLNAAYWRMLGVPERKLGFMPYAVDNTFFRARNGGGTAELRRSLGIPEGAPIILYASKMHPRKHPEHLLEAFRRLPGMSRVPHLIFIGDGEMRAELEQRAAGMDTVRFLGFRGQRELQSWYALCDVFVLPSVRETWGLVVNEVMNLGKAVIVSDQVGSGADLVHDGDNGFIYPAGDIDALARTLHETLADPERAPRMGRRSLEIVGGWDFEADVRGLRRALGLGEGS
ncbi:glycosyltransferase family 4 protein [Azospirillum sp.]|uniref:glycosyltransferase family 4 protein n=1 Tax=Azospirillum sp. TaxID=34012 RepID=UPI003D74A1C0